MTSLLPYEVGKYRRPQVVWMHASDVSNFAALECLSHRLLQLTVETKVVITSSLPKIQLCIKDTDFDGLSVIETPIETNASIQSFLNKYQPSFLIWSGGELRSSLLQASAERGTTMILTNIRAKDFPLQRLRFLPDSNRRALKTFSRYYAVEPSGADRLTRMGIVPSKIEIKGPLQQATPVIFLPKELDKDLSAACMGRMVWLAASVTRKEAKIVLQAHRLVMRQSHRSLLILVPASTDIELDIIKMAREIGLFYSVQSAGEVADTNTQAIICASSKELYSWYALAPVAFLGQSVFTNKASLDPYSPAAFGCALLYGPNISSFKDRYSRLTEQGAARIIKDVESLFTAVVEITNPEQSAKMAYAAWNIISEGAELTDSLVGQIVDHLDRPGL